MIPYSQVLYILKFCMSGLSFVPSVPLIPSRTRFWRRQDNFGQVVSGNYSSEHLDDVFIIPRSAPGCIGGWRGKTRL